MKSTAIILACALLSAANPVAEVEKRDKYCNLDVPGGVYTGTCRNGVTLDHTEKRPVREAERFGVNCVCQGENIHGLA